jgi:uncharacterized repeat protein (TIGR03803 family)
MLSPTSLGCLKIALFLALCVVIANAQYKVLHNVGPFGNGDGNSPAGTVVIDANGNLYSTTTLGGPGGCSPPSGCGTVWELAPNSNGRWNYSIIHSFAQSDGIDPYVGVVFDQRGSLYGVTTNAGPGGFGTVFELTPKQQGMWTFSVLHGFNVRTMFICKAFCSSSGSQG